ncbi:hypothetical protein BRADI_2g60080v3 [Brachypodium distachyon]|uniref:YDG domain-containing protein n=2 Tax=Brachypodium distachyon TaxID=15368 RepID=I1HUZ7_BRADI|nr:hypothetical protein BRADI_2g60080v3 [Brachypodium distachyon]
MASSSAAAAPLLTPKPDPDAPLPAPTVEVTPELCAALRRELERSPDDLPDFVHGLRLAQERLDAISAYLVSARPPMPPLTATPTATTPMPPPAATPPMPPPAATKRPLVAPEASSSAAAKGKRRARGTGATEMVRATVPAGPDHVHARNLVRRARLIFEALRVVYHRGDAGAGEGARKRADLSALSVMFDRGLGLYRDVRIVGSIPGVFVGDVFFYRAELCVVGLHNHVQGGIGYIPASVVSKGKPVATSIVSSGGYLDDHDGGGDVLVYTGSGGRPRNGGEHFADQKLEGGNLSLVYSCEYGIEVRVVRSHDCEASPSGKAYVYDGLYKVESSTYGPGKSGPDVCKFKLVRIPGQGELGSSVWHAAGELGNALASGIRPRGYLSLDLSKGKERLRVPVCNKVDQDSSPLDFEYIAHPDFRAARVPRPVKRYKACHCGTTCGAARSAAAACKCVCVRKNGGGPVYNADGTLVRGRPVVYECGALCGCPAASCLNRATQRGMEHQLEVFRSKETEWGVRTLGLIQPGAFVCEYSGDVVTVDDGQSTDWGCFVDPRKFPARWREWGDASAVLPDEEGHKFPEPITGPGYVLDVSRRRNFAAYISHSSAPNVFVQFVIRGNEDESFPHLMVFAMDTIPPMRELSIDYGIDQQG